MTAADTDSPAAEFDHYAGDGEYQAAIDRGIAFAGVEHHVFLQAKANVLLRLAATVGNPARLSMLDVGCGVGAFARHLIDHVGDLHGIDIADECAARAARDVPAGTFAGYDGRRIPYDDRRFDVAYAVCVFHHVDPADRQPLVAEMARVVRPGGVAAIFEHNPWNPLTRLVVSRIPFDDGVELLPLRESRTLLQQAGLAAVRGRYMLFAPSASSAVQRGERALGWLPVGAQHVAYGYRR